MTDVAPPATGVWYDLQDIVEELLGILRLTEQDVDVERIQGIVPHAAWRLDQHRDGVEVREGPPPSAADRHALVTLSAEMYRGVAPSVTGEPGDAFDSVRADALPQKRRWGTA